MEKLKSCPFCGREAKLVEFSNGNFSVICKNAKCTVVNYLGGEMKTCSRGDLACQWASLNGTGVSCNYEKYCDHQLPRDSRQEDEKEGKDEIFFKRLD